MTDLIQQLNNLSDVQLPTLALLAVIGFIVIFYMIQRNQNRRDSTMQSVITTLSEQVKLTRDAYQEAQDEFRALRSDNKGSDDAILKTLEKTGADVKDNSRTQTDRAIGVVEKKIETESATLQSSINLIGDQVQKMTDVLSALETKVETHHASDSEMKIAINAVKGMAEATLSLIKARQNATGELPPEADDGDARAGTILESLSPPGEIKRATAAEIESA